MVRRLEVIWLIAGFGVGAVGMWTILQAQSGNNFGLGGSSGQAPNTGPANTQTAPDLNPPASDAPDSSPG